MNAGGPYNITATSVGCEIALNDVLFGDVWFCSGQSNMVHRMDNVSIDVSQSQRRYLFVSLFLETL